MLLEEGPFRSSQSGRRFLPMFDEIVRNTQQTDVMQPGGDLEEARFLGRQLKMQGHGSAQLKGAASLAPQNRIEGFQRADAELDGMVNVSLEPFGEAR